MIELYLALERATGEGNIHKAQAAARAIGYTFDNRESAKWLKPFIEDAQSRRAAPAAAPKPAPDLSTKQHLGSTENSTRARVIELIPSIPGESSELLRNSSSSPRVKKTRAVRERKNRKLPFDREILDRRDAILHAVWDQLQPFLHVATSFTTWGARNRKIAADLARNWSPEQIVDAWQRASAGHGGEPIRQLSLVQKFIEMGATASAKEHRRE